MKNCYQYFLYKVLIFYRKFYKNIYEFYNFVKKNYLLKNYCELKLLKT